METPDKIYLHPDIGGREFIRPWLHRAANSESVAYIRKDALLEWAKEKKKQLFEQESANDEPSDVAAGINAGLDMVIGKLNSM